MTWYNEESGKLERLQIKSALSFLVTNHLNKRAQSHWLTYRKVLVALLGDKYFFHGHVVIYGYVYHVDSTVQFIVQAHGK